MRILHVFKDYYPPTPGGIEHLVHAIVHGLDGRAECSVLTGSRSRRLVVEDEDGVTVTRAPEWFRISSAPVAPAWRKLLGESTADVIHFHMPNPTAELAFLAARLDRPAVATYHADIARFPVMSALYSPFRERFLSRMKRITFSSPPFLDSTEPVRKHRDRCVVVPFGVDVGAWTHRPSRADEIRRSVQTPVVLFLGRLVHYKGVDVLVEAMRNVAGTALIAGDGPFRGAIQKAILRSGLEGRVRMCGFVSPDEQSAYYHAADVVVLPSVSRGESYGLVLVEAMAAGTPVVSTELGTGTSWVNLDRVTGRVAPSGDPDALAEAINDVLSDETRRLQMGSAARDRASELFDRATMLDSLFELYRSVS